MLFSIHQSMLKSSVIVIFFHTTRGPVNEDVFAAPTTAEAKSIDSDIQEITEQIHRLLVQVRNLIHS